MFDVTLCSSKKKWKIKKAKFIEISFAVICLFVAKTTNSMAFHLLILSYDSDINRKIEVAGNPV
jgi:hypothetical protein